MIAHIAQIEISDLKKFLLEKRGEISATAFEELIFALFIAKFYSKRSGKSFNVGVPIKRPTIDKKLDSIEDINEYLECLLKTYEDKDTPIDFFVTPGDVDLAIKTNRKGHAFQLKRFTTFSNEGDVTGRFLEYLEKTIPKKYAPVEATLLLYIGATMERINFDHLSKLFSPDKYPFEMVSIIGRRGPNLAICQIWPELHKFECDPVYLLSDVQSS